MEILLAIFSWAVTISLPLLLLSIPIEGVVNFLVKDWKGSKTRDVYQKIQFGLLGLFLVSLILTIGLMIIPH